MSAIREDSSGLLWIFVSVPGHAWRTAWDGIPSGAREVRVSRIAIDKLFRTIIEVIDPRSARVVAHQLVEEWIVASLSERLAAVYSVDADGEPEITIVELALSGL